MRETLPAMAVFAAVVEEGGFTQGARRLGLSKSAASKQVARLEDRLGARLLVRTTRRVNTTEAGDRFYERCRRIIAEAEAAEAEVGQARDQPNGTLRVSAPVSFGYRRLAKPFAEFLSAYPDVAAVIALNDRKVDLIEEGFDLALRIGDLEDSSLIRRRLCPISLTTAAAPDYLAARGTPAHPGDLKEHDCLGYDYLEGGAAWSFHGPTGAIRRRFKPRIHANNGDILAAAAIAGHGILHVPTFTVTDALAAGTLLPVLEDWASPDLALYAVYPAGRPLPAKTRVFIDFLAGHFASFTTSLLA